LSAEARAYLMALAVLQGPRDTSGISASCDFLEPSDGNSML